MKWRIGRVKLLIKTSKARYMIDSDKSRQSNLFSGRFLPETPFDFPTRLIRLRTSLEADSSAKGGTVI